MHVAYPPFTFLNEIPRFSFFPGCWQRIDLYAMLLPLVKRKKMGSISRSLAFSNISVSSLHNQVHTKHSSTLVSIPCNEYIKRVPMLILKEKLSRVLLTTLLQFVLSSHVWICFVWMSKTQHIMFLISRCLLTLVCLASMTAQQQSCLSIHFNAKRYVWTIWTGTVWQALRAFSLKWFCFTADLRWSSSAMRVEPLKWGRILSLT